MFTLTLVFNQDKTHVLMCDHKKLNAFNFIGGKSNILEDLTVASYRELFEETGIPKEAIDLKFVRQESVTTNQTCWSMFITAGVLKEDVELKPEKNELFWVDINDIEVFLSAYGDGNCYTFLKESMRVLNINA